MSRKRLLTAVFSVVILLIALACKTPAKNNQPTVTAQVGQPFSVGSFSYVIQQPQTMRRIGNQFSSEAPAPGAIFVVVRYTETNNGQESYTGAGAPLELVDAQNRRFQPSSRVETALIMTGGHGDMLPQLQPGVAHQGVTGFEIPETAAHGRIQIAVKERGLLGNGIGAVTVNMP